MLECQDGTVYFSDTSAGHASADRPCDIELGFAKAAHWASCGKARDKTPLCAVLHYVQDMTGGSMRQCPFSVPLFFLSGLVSVFSLSF